MRLRDLLGVLLFVVFLLLFVFMMNKISAPNATFELGDYVIVVDLILAFVFLMIAWGPVVNGEPIENSLPFRVPSYIGIPLGVALFVFLYVSGLGELLLHVNEVVSPAVALTVAALILGGATYLSSRPDPVQQHETGAESAHTEGSAGDTEHTATSVGPQPSAGPQH